MGLPKQGRVMETFSESRQIKELWRERGEAVKKSLAKRERKEHENMERGNL